MLIRNKLLLSAVIGVGSVILLVLIVFIHYRQEQERGKQLLYLSVLAEAVDRIDYDFYRFVVAPDSSTGHNVVSRINDLSELLAGQASGLEENDLGAMSEKLMARFVLFQQLRLNHDISYYSPEAVEILLQIRELIINARFVIQRQTEDMAYGVLEAEESQSRLIMIFILPALLVAITLIILTSRDLIVKMNRLLTDTGRIEKGEFGHRVAVTGQDEFGRISEAVNRVTDALNQARMKEQSYRQDMLKRTDQVNLLKELALVANRIHNISELYRLVTERLRSYTGWISAHVFILSKDGSRLVSSDIWSCRDRELVAGFIDQTSRVEFKMGEGLIGRVFANGESEWLEDASEAEWFSRQKSASEAGIRTVAAFPVLVEGKVHAVIELHCQKRIARDPDLTELFRGVGALISHVISREQFVATLNMQTEQLNYALDSAGMYSWSIDLETGDYQLSRNFRKILGLNADRTGSIDEFQSMIHQHDLPDAVVRFRKLTDEYQGYSSEFRFTGDDGKERYLWSKGDVIHDHEGSPLKVAGIVMDMTERRLIDSLLEASERNYRLLFENSPLPLWIFTRRAQKVVDANAMVEKMFGYKSDELQRMTLLQLLHEESREQFLEVIEKAGAALAGEGKQKDAMPPGTSTSLSTSEIGSDYSSENNHTGNIPNPGTGSTNTTDSGVQSYTSIEVRILNASGSWVDVQLFVASITYLDEPCVIATCIDITDLKQTRKRLLGSIIEGEDRERQRVAVELHDGIGQYLTATNLNLEALRKDVEKLPPKKYQQFMNGLVLLGMAIDETRNLAYTLMPKTLNDYGLEVSLKSLIDKLRKTSIPDIFFYARFDEEKLDEQMRINIYRIIQEGIGNAIRHSKGTKIDVQAVLHDYMLAILIEDNGIGFDSASMMKKNKGIGLQSVQNRVISMNGRIEIDSVKGRGTSISIELPLPKRRI